MLHINRVRLVMCQDPKENMVETIFQYLSSCNSHDDILSFPNMVREYDSQTLLSYIQSEQFLNSLWGNTI